MATAIIFEDSLTVPACERLEAFQQWTRSDAFPGHGRIDWIGGRIEVDMSPENLFTHGTLKTELAAKVYGVIREGDRGEVFVDRTRVTCRSADLSAEPDVMVVTHAAVDSGRVTYGPGSGQSRSFVEIQGGPDLIIEIVSDASVQKDTRRLPPAYHAAGVRELWLVDARSQPPVFQVLRHGEQAYEPNLPDTDGWMISPVLERQIRLTVHATARGTPRYDLQIRSLPQA